MNKTKRTIREFFPFLAFAIGALLRTISLLFEQNINSAFLGAITLMCMSALMILFYFISR
ncbi:MAG: hypothetical protein O8C66_08695 [Candidatus Methanoperedens sp.]|nr:hypothetical protein [Candidatus Methanoperedens sp.]MCZ7370573.1 hypothetical protein [Candidatus Methanoperedens sp.]